MLAFVSRTCSRVNTTRPGLSCHVKATGCRPFLQRALTVLALESSADDTCAAVVTSDRKILSNVVVKQHTEHNEYGGIHPFVALKAHQRHMPAVVRQALDDANISVNDVDGIAFTRGPGMAGCLNVCSNAAKTLAAALGKPLVGVHHMQAHALTPLLTTPEVELPQFPFLTLLVSGGHTLLLLATSPTSFKTLATTLDVSAGRAIDKVSLALGLKVAPLGLGPALEAFCASGPPYVHLPKGAENLIMQPAMRGRLAFSFGGLQSTFERSIKSCGGAENMTENVRIAIARNLENSIFTQLGEKVMLGLQWCEKNDIIIHHLVVSGGVASNMRLRSSLLGYVKTACPDRHVALVFPPPALCTDNAVMIAWASMQRFLQGDHDDYSVELRETWNIEELEASPAALAAL